MGKNDDALNVTAPTEFGELVKQHLYRQRRTQNWLAEVMSIAPASLSRAMRGGRRIGADKVLLAAQALELSPDQEHQLLTAAGYTGARAHSASGWQRRSPRSVRVPEETPPAAPSLDDIGAEQTEDDVFQIVDDLKELLDRLAARGQIAPETAGFLRSGLRWLLAQDRA